MLVRITATDQDLESFCYLPLKSGEVYFANQVGTKYFDVIFDNQTIVRGMHESRLQILDQAQIRDFRINQLGVLDF